jgi:integrase/recombinase XerC
MKNTDPTRQQSPLSPSSTLEEALAVYLRSLLGANKSSATIRAYQTDLAQFLAFLHETNLTARMPSDVTRADVTEYLSHLAQRNLSGVTRARKLATLREYFRFLQGLDVVEKSPCAGVATPKKERTGRTTLRVDEYTKLLSLAGSNPRDYAILQIFLQTGVRVSELCALTLADVDVRGRAIRVRDGKGQKERSIDLEKKGILAIKNYLDVRGQSPYEQLFLNYQGEPISERGVRKLVAKYLKASGITKKISPHSLRHTFATRKAEKGVSPYQLKEWLGHANLNTTQLYVHLSRQSGQKVMEATSL